MGVEPGWNTYCTDSIDFKGAQEQLNVAPDGTITVLIPGFYRINMTAPMNGIGTSFQRILKNGSQIDHDIVSPNNNWTSVQRTPFDDGFLLAGLETSRQCSRLCRIHRFLNSDCLPASCAGSISSTYNTCRGFAPVSLLARLLKFRSSIFGEGPPLFSLFKFFAILLHEPELEGSSTEGPSIFVYAMY